MSTVILIGGSPTAGKSYTARKIAEEFKLPWISTDTIRSQMRKIVRREDYPHLFDIDETSGEVTAEKYLNSHTVKEIVDHQCLESKDVWKGAKALIEGDYNWKSFIIEGVAVLPKLVNEVIDQKEKRIIPIFLVDSDRKRVRNTVYTRGLWDAADTYPDTVKDKEVDWVFEFNKMIMSEAKKYGFPVVDIGNRVDYLEEIKKIIKSR
ncbi:hypothetical protein C4544_06340 [candidate division WS5 bacterium]|uniref:2-phosphoglycerate kinase n=1 Tax=candidate division WS5 bacterium TaxID=2093353 RepID=A0A419DA10_9BACT|nr:MAG: hypothetical protein C4544_06340 [candidate division WS5 bacterium]